MSSIDHVEGSEAGGGRSMVVECKFSTRKVLVPILLVWSDVAAEVCPGVPVCVFRLSTSLRMVGSAEIEVGAQLGEEFLPEIRCEFGISVRNERLRHAVQAEDVVTKYSSELDGRLAHFGGDDVYVLG